MNSHRIPENDSPDRSTVESLLQIARQFGTPAYAYDLRRVREQAEKLRAHLADTVEVFYSLKANASLGICDVIAECGLGADVASAGELVAAVEAGFPAERIFVAGPYKSPETVSRVRTMPEVVISVDSYSELRRLGELGLSNPMVLRLRPDFDSAAAVAAGPESRFGVTTQDLPACRDYLESGRVQLIGFHIFAGSQVLDAAGVVGHVRGSIDLAFRAAEVLRVTPAFINLGGGFGIPYAPRDGELDLGPIAVELRNLAEQNPTIRLAFELGRYLVAQAGWYLTTVVGHQSFQGRKAVVVDGGTHQRADLCGLGLRNKAAPPLVLDVDGPATIPTDVLGCLSLPADVLAQSSPLPSLAPGNVLAFANAGAYGLWSSPTNFHGFPLPTEVAFDGDSIQVMRAPAPAEGVLDGQSHISRERCRTVT